MSLVIGWRVIQVGWEDRVVEFPSRLKVCGQPLGREPYLFQLKHWHYYIVLTPDDRASSLHIE